MIEIVATSRKLSLSVGVFTNRNINKNIMKKTFPYRLKLIAVVLLSLSVGVFTNRNIINIQQTFQKITF
jgi:hypothetical protein